MTPQAAAQAAPPDEAALPSLAGVGALIGDPVRAAILLQLTDGSRRPAGELALLAGASPQAASAHLAKLVGGGLLRVESLGRHRFYAIASGEAAEMIEGLANWAGGRRPVRRHDPMLCRARLCYDHLAGRLGVAFYEAMAARDFLCLGAEGAGLSAAGRAFCADHGIDPTVPRGSRRPQLRLCLDWTERRHHLGGHVGAAVARRLIDAGHLRRLSGERSLEITPRGVTFLSTTLDIDLTREGRTKSISKNS